MYKLDNKADIVWILIISLEPLTENYEVAEVLSLHSNSISGVPYGVTHNLDLEKSIKSLAIQKIFNLGL